MDESAVREIFSKQRRALIATSLILVLVQSAGVTLTEVQALGATLQIARPQALPIALWIAWAYFCIRYYQYFRALDTNALSRRYQSRLIEVMTTEAQRQMTAKHPDFHGSVEYRSYRYAFQSGSVKDRLGKQWTVLLNGSVVYENAGAKTQLPFSNRPEVVQERPWTRLGARAHVALHTPFATEYFLPFVVASTPPILAVTLPLIRSLSGRTG